MFDDEWLNKLKYIIDGMIIYIGFITVITLLLTIMILVTK